ncbi:IMP cyclohydrolase [Candidatus Woesearchaeota archaeon]|nr:IMP cyclohydrolase [Candidatus Woesearchaeota archaeon]
MREEVSEMARGTDVSSFKEAYKTPVQADFPAQLEIKLGQATIRYEPVDTALRYGTNPHQPFAAYRPVIDPQADATLSVGDLTMLKGGKAGLSLTNIQDMSQAYNLLKYFKKPACVAMKHIVPCGFKAQTEGEALGDLYNRARLSDERSHFGSVVGFNRRVDEETAERVMESFVECVIAPGYTNGALKVLRSNEGTKKLNNSIRVAQAGNMDKLPKYVGDDVDGFLNIRSLADGTITLEVPYLTRIRSANDFVQDPMIPNPDGKDYIVETAPTQEQLSDALTAWYLNVGVRSNGIVFVRNGAALAVGTGEQERVGAVEQAIDKAHKKGHSLEGSVMSSDAFFPNRDSIDAAAEAGVSTIVWPAGSMNDKHVIEAANEHDIALIATLERCFLHI